MEHITLASGKEAGFGGPLGFPEGSKEGREVALGTGVGSDTLLSLLNNQVKHEANITWGKLAEHPCLLELISYSSWLPFTTTLSLTL